MSPERKASRKVDSTLGDARATFRPVRPTRPYLVASLGSARKDRKVVHNAQDGGGNSDLSQVFDWESIANPTTQTEGADPGDDTIGLGRRAAGLHHGGQPGGRPLLHRAA